MTPTARLRAAGLAVVEHGAPARPGAFAPSGVLLHHTAGPATGDAPSLGVALNGRADVPGPLYQLLVARSGTVHVLTGGPRRSRRLGLGARRRRHPRRRRQCAAVGLAAESPGLAPDWPPAQWAAVHAAARVLLDGMGAGVERLWRHRDYTPRKVDTGLPAGRPPSRRRRRDRPRPGG